MTIGRVSLMWAAAALALLVAPAAARAAEPHDAILAAVAAGDTATALEALGRAEAEDAARFRANNYDYLLARVLEMRGDYAGAAARYAGVADRGSNLAEYALWRLAGLARTEGNFAVERRYLERLVARYPASLLYSRAVVRIGRGAFESGEYQTALARLGPLAGTNGAGSRDALARVAVARLELGDRVGARRDFTRLIDGAQDDFALEAARGLDRLDADEKVALTEFEHVRRGRIYMFNRDWLGGRKHFAAVADISGAQNRAEALYSVGLTYYRVEDPTAAIDWWEKAAREFPNDPVGIKAYLWVGHAYQRAGKFAEAVARYADFVARYPNDEQAEGAYRNAIDSLRSAGDAANALAWCDRAEAAQPRSPLATFAAFNRAKIRLVSGDAAAALAEFTRLKSGYNLRAAGPGMPTPDEVDLLRGVCLERLGRVAEAVAVYLALEPGREAYFGNRATARLLALAARPETKASVAGVLDAALASARSARASGNAAAAKAAADRALRLTEDPALRAEMLAILRASYAALPAYARVSGQQIPPVARGEVAGGAPGVADRSHEALAAELAFLGLFDEAAPELEASGFGTRSPYAMAVYNARGSRGDGAIQTGEPLASRLPADFRVELLPRDVAALVYPAPYRDELRKFALPSGVDPRFELSIARQESRFKPSVKSAAAARGLMQFIPETASRIATALEVARFDQDDLYEPDVAVRFGARYLADLFGMFPDNPYAVAASYNGGEDNVARWARRAADPKDVDLVVAEISYKETKTYVYRVMNNYWAYQALYTNELNPT
jgi:soluble lytic murein transglycosylase